ncbi:MAG: hypothetical protein AseanaTS_03150 [Candidatus Pelagadaptatus aseana]|uniref:hypothetical protein n=1 Tax=Candidatus Pelagadaptatus aseana TaxID=3120508 RepID=UPI0039B259A1
MALKVALVIIGFVFAAHSVAEPEPCDVAASKTVAYVSKDSRDTLSVQVSGAPCSQALVSIKVTSEQGAEIYAYQGEFIKHMLYLIREPELNHLVQFFVDKVIGSAVTRTTDSLPEYTGIDAYYEANNDYLLITVEDYNQLRQESRPILWHITSESTWLHSVYDPQSKASVQIMRGGVFY